MPPDPSPPPAATAAPAPAPARSDADADMQAEAYVCAVLESPRASLSTPAQRAAFVDALLGPASLSRAAEDDVALLRQLEARAAALVRECARVAARDPHVADVDALVALLALVATRCPVLLRCVERAHAVAFVVRVMRTFRERPSVVARALAALAAFAVTDPMRKRVMIDAGIDIALELMAVYRNNRRVQDRATAVIANVAFGCTHRKRRITRQGAVRKIIDGMAAFPHDESIQMHGALAIRNLTHDAQVNQYIAGNEGAVEAISSTLLRFRGGAADPALRFHCVLALESLCRDDERNRQRLADIESLAMSTVDLSNSSPDAVPPHYYCLDDEEETVNEDGDIIVDDEQVLVPDVTPQFRHGAALCPGKSASRLIASPSTSSGRFSERTTPSLVLDETKLNIPDQPDNTSSHKASREEQQQQQDKTNRKKSIIRAIIHAMRRDPDDPHLLESALSLLTLIALHRCEVQTRVVDLGGIHVAIATIKRHAACPSVVAKASALIRCLCVQESNRSQVTSGLPVLISAAREHCKDADVVREVASALSNAVFEHEKNRASVVSQGGVQVIVRAMKECGRSDTMVLEAAICAFRCFVDSSNSGALVAAQDGAVRAALTALDDTKAASSTGERIVQEQAVMFLVDLARLAPQTSDEMKEIDAADWIENALAKLPIEEYRELHAAGDRLINFLTRPDYVKHGLLRKGGYETTPPSPTAISGRGHSRGIFSAFSLPRRMPPKGVSNPRRKPIIKRSMPINNSDSETKSKRFSFQNTIGSGQLSARLMKSAALS